MNIGTIGANIITAKDLAFAQLSAGDSVMFRLWEHVKDDGGRIDEQIDKHTGKQAWHTGFNPLINYAELIL